MWTPKKIICFSANVGRHFYKSNNVGGHFCPGFQAFCPNFQVFCPDFWQIKTFGGALAPPAPRFLHHWDRTYRPQQSVRATCRKVCYQLIACLRSFYTRRTAVGCVIHVRSSFVWLNMSETTNRCRRFSTVEWNLCSKCGGGWPSPTYFSGGWNAALTKFFVYFS